MADNTKKEKKHFFKGLKAELKKVIWPTPKQTANGTLGVVAVIIIVATVVFALDTGFSEISELGARGIKHIVSPEESNSDDTDGSNEDAGNNAELDGTEDTENIVVDNNDNPEEDQENEDNPENSEPEQ
jgi:preprotein translocase, SecE subunit, bacterial